MFQATTTLRQRALMFFIGGVIAYLVSTPVLQASLLWSFVIWGFVAVLMYEIMRRTRSLVHVFAIPLYVVVGIFLLLPIVDFLFALLLDGRLSPNWLSYVLAGRLYRDALRAPFGVYLIGCFTFFVFLGYFLIKGPVLMNRQTRKLEIEAVGYGNIEMQPSRSETTRFLCASAILLGVPFRQMVLQRAKVKYRALAPEIGLDLALLIRVCRYLESREITYHLLFFSLSVLALIFARSGGSFILFLLVASAIQCYKLYDERYRLLQHFTKEKYDPERVTSIFQASLDTELAEAIPPDDQNLLVYRSFSPFVGAGLDHDGWSFAMDLSCPKEEMGRKLEIQPFEVKELAGAIEAALRELEFRGLVIEDYLFVNGVDVRDDRSILPQVLGRPVAHVGREQVERYAQGCDHRIRHYKWVRVHAWGNDLIVSYFLRLSTQGLNLFIELNRRLLTPLNFQYRQVDAVAPRTWRNVAKLVVSSPLAAIVGVLYAWITLFAKVSESIGEQLGSSKREQRREVKENPVYNYGVAESLREQVASALYMHYFQKLDREMYVKIIEREILNTIIKFLDAHNIDTSEAHERQQVILNNGVIVHGGNVQAQTLAVGSNAKATTHQGPAVLQQAVGGDKKE